MKQPVDFIKDERMKAEFAAYLNAQTTEEEERVVSEYNQWFASLSNEEQQRVTAERLASLKAMIEGTKDNLEELDARIMRQKLGEVPQAISLSYIATQCGKSKAWLSQRLNGNKVNGKEARFTPSEALMFQNALHDLGQKLLKVALV